MKTNTQIITCLYKHILKLSQDNTTLAKERISIIISMTNGNRRFINRLNNESTRTWVELEELTKKLIQYYDSPK